MRFFSNYRSAMITLIVFQAVMMLYFSVKNNSPFLNPDTFFIWGVLDFLLGLTFIFGFENRMINQTYTRSGGDHYTQNVSNFIGNISKYFFDREKDFSSGQSIILLGMINIITYGIMINIK